jgi:hypothetical protein
MNTPQITARDWLARNGYEDVARKIDKVASIWAKKETHTRRNWWDVLAGTPDGKSRTIEGIRFPVLRAARLRKGWVATPDSLCRNADEAAPEIIRQARWSKHQATPEE